jgi:hypothetical protein
MHPSGGMKRRRSIMQSYVADRLRQHGHVFLFSLLESGHLFVTGFISLSSGLLSRHWHGYITKRRASNLPW